MANTTMENSKTMEQALALWKHKTKRTHRTYFTGTVGDVAVVGFYNTHKKNPNEPDIRVYSNTIIAGERVLGDEVCSLWANHSEEKEMFYFTGKLNNKNVVGFIYNGDNSKAPYLSIYYREDNDNVSDVSGEITDIINEIDCETGEITSPEKTIFD